MREWIHRQLSSVFQSLIPIRLIIDPDRLLSENDMAELGALGETVVVTNWVELRRVYEASGRLRPPDDTALFMIVHAQDFLEPRQLPYDIAQEAEVVRIRLVVSEPLRALVLALTEDVQDVAIAAANGADPLGRLLEAVWGLSVPITGTNLVTEIDAVVRLRTDPTVPGELWPRLTDRLANPLARGLAQEPVDTRPIQAAWEEWVALGEHSVWDQMFEQVGARITSLFHIGLLTPVPASRDLPGWARSGVEQPGWVDIAGSLLDIPPMDGSPVDLGGWIRLAEWWGEVRLAIAMGAPETGELADRSWLLWEQWDEDFRRFLHSDFGKLLTSSSGRPQTVNRIAPFLARRLREGQAKRLMLVVFDGMGFAHWSLLRREAGLQVLDTSGALAVAPTLTPVSRQAIFAGTLPREFADKLTDTTSEASLWRSFWENEGLPSGASVMYTNIDGKTPQEIPSFGDASVVGLVVRAIDELMHSSEMFGEVQFTSNVVTWLKHGFVSSLVLDAHNHGFEVWFTADHGSLQVVPLGRPMEGLAVDTAGTRVRLYPTKALRDQSKAEGDDWFPPGMPDSGPFPLFPWGRFGFRHNIRVTHGGLSFDEMVVPLVRVAP